MASQSNESSKSPTALGKMIDGMMKSSDPHPADGFTLGWDVVVSYSQEEINQNLKSKWEKNPSTMISDIETDMTMFLPWGKSRIKYRLKKLGAPLVQFPAKLFREPVFNLHIPILAGSTQQMDLDTGETPLGPEAPLLENAFTIILKSINIGTVVGKYDDVKGKKERNAKTLDIQGSKNTCVFKDRSGAGSQEDFEVAWVVFDFPVDPQELQVAIDLRLGEDASKDTQQMAQSMRACLQTAMEGYFKGGEGIDRLDIIQYALATVKDKRPPKESVSLNLTPKSFRMAAFSASYTTRGVLSLFIETANGTDGGEINNLQALWLGQWTKHEMSPLPDSHTASIIFHPGLVYHRLFAPFFLKNPSKDWKLTILPEQKGGGIAFQAAYQPKLKSEVVFLPMEFPKSMWDWLPGGDPDKSKLELEMSEVNEDISKNPATIHMIQTDAEAPPVVKINWSFWISNIWRVKQTDTGWLPRVAYFNRQKNTCTFTLNHNLSLKINATDFDLTISMDGNDLISKWGFSEESVPMNDSMEQKLLNHLNDNPPEGIMEERKKHLLKVSPKFEFGTLGLDFFLTTNLLNPGSNVIKIDQKVGMRVPSNLVLVGSVATGEDPVK